jgi:hypothetical protein
MCSELGLSWFLGLKLDEGLSVVVLAGVGRSQGGPLYIVGAVLIADLLDSRLSPYLLLGLWF